MPYCKNEFSKLRLAAWSMALVLCLALSIPALAQQATGTILGVVKDAQGGAVASATVIVRNSETGLTRELTTGDDGAFRAPALPVGGYSVKVEKAGFKSSTHDGLSLAVTQEMVVNFSLEVGAATTEVTVTGEAPQVETTTSTLGGLVDEKRMVDLPLNGRNYADLTLLQPGVSKAVNVGNINQHTQGTWMSSNGAPLRSNNYTLDGLRLNNQQGANTASGGGNTLGLDGIREYIVVTDMFGAEYGIGAGSQVVMTSRGGTNNFHGDAFDYLRNTVLDANVNVALHRAAGRGSIVKRPAHIKNNFGGAFGGPIKKDKMFFYANYEGIREVVNGGSSTHSIPFGGNACPNGAVYTPAGIASNTPIIQGTPDIMVHNHGTDVPVSGDLTTTNACLVNNQYVGNQQYVNPYSVIPASLAPFPNSGSNYVSNALSHNGENYGQLRFDDTISANDSFFVRFTEDEFHAINDSSYPEYGNKQAGRAYFASIGESHVFSASLLNSFRFGFSRSLSDAFNFVKTANAASSGIPFWAACPTLDCSATVTSGPSTDQIVSYSMSNNSPTGAPCPTGAFVVGYGAPGNFGSTGCNDANTGQNLYSLSDDMFYSKGKHALKFGILANRWNQIVGPGAGGSNSIGGEIQFGAPALLLAGVPFPFWDLRTTKPDGGQYFTYNTVGLYAQDDIRATSRLTLNVGLRYEFSTTPVELSGKSNFHQDITTSSYQGTLGNLIQNNTLRNFSPRLGFAWDVTGKGKTAIRGGFGVYYDVGSIGSALTQSSNANGLTSSYWVGNPIYSYSPAFTLPLPTIGATGGGAAFAPVDSRNLVLHALDYNLKSPYIRQYNLTIQQQLPWNMALTVGYVGSEGINLFRLEEQNPFKTIPCTGNFCLPNQPYWGMDPASPQGRVNPNFSSATFVTTDARSWYNAAQASLSMKQYHGLDLQLAYTFSKNLDTTQGQQYVFDCFGAQGSGQPVYPSIGGQPNLDGDKAPSCFDATHNLHINFTYHFPNLRSNGFLSKIANGWWTSNIISMQSGYPFNINTAGLISNSGVFNFDQGEKPNLVTSKNFNTAKAMDQNAMLYNPATVVIGDPSNWINTDMFTLAGPNADAIGVAAGNPDGQCTGAVNDVTNSTYAFAPGTTPTAANSNYGNVAFGPTCYFGYMGNEPRNDLRGARTRQWDLSLAKDTKMGFLGEAASLQFRADFFNMLNHANWGFIGNTPFVACAPFSQVPYSYSGGASNGACAGSNEGGIDHGANYHGTAPLRQIQFALKLVF